MDPRDALDVLKAHANEPDFYRRWMGFVRACTLLLPDLPAEAREWSAAADDYEAGRLTAEGLTAVRVRAWKLHDDRRADATPPELAAIRVAMHRLWPDLDPAHWVDGAWFFLEACESLGLAQAQWWPLLRARFPDVLGDG